MSAKAKSKGNESNHKSDEADVAVIAAIAAVPAEAAAEAVAETPAAATPAKEPLIVRVKAATGTAVVRSFATLRVVQTTAIQRTLAWLAGLDAVLARSLTTGEGFLLAKLGAQTPGGYENVASSEARAPQ